MDFKMEITVDEKGRKVCIFEDEKISIHIVLKKDYSNVESKLRDLQIIRDIEEALETVPTTDEFKELVDSYGFLYLEKISD
jgi:hypothetical protein